MTIMIGNINKWLDICGKSDWRGILLNGMASLQDTFPNCFSKQNQVERGKNIKMKTNFNKRSPGSFLI